MGHTCASCASWSSSTMAVAVSILGEPKVEGVASGSDRPASLHRSHFPFDLIRGPGPTALGQTSRPWAVTPPEPETVFYDRYIA